MECDNECDNDGNENSNSANDQHFPADTPPPSGAYSGPQDDMVSLSEKLDLLCQKIESISDRLSEFSEEKVLDRIKKLEDYNSNMSPLTKSQAESIISAAVTASGAHAVTVAKASLEHESARSVADDPKAVEIRERWKFFAGVTTAVITLVGNIVTAFMLYMQHSAK